MHGKEVAAVMSSDFWAFTVPLWHTVKKVLNMVEFPAMLLFVCYMTWRGWKNSQIK